MTKPETPAPSTNDSFVKEDSTSVVHVNVQTGETSYSKTTVVLDVGDHIRVGKHVYKLIPSGQLNPRNHEPLVTLKVVG